MKQVNQSKTGNSVVVGAVASARRQRGHIVSRVARSLGTALSNRSALNRPTSLGAAEKQHRLDAHCLNELAHPGVGFIVENTEDWPRDAVIELHGRARNTLFGATEILSRAIGRAAPTRPCHTRMPVQA